MTERKMLWAFLFGNFLIGTGVITGASARERSDRPAYVIVSRRGTSRHD